MFKIIKKELLFMGRKVNFEERNRIERQTRNELEKVKLNFEARTKNWPIEEKEVLSKTLEKQIMMKLINNHLYN